MGSISFMILLANPVSVGMLNAVIFWLDTFGDFSSNLFFFPNGGRKHLNSIQFPTLVEQLRVYEKATFFCNTFPNTFAYGVCRKG